MHYRLWIGCLAAYNNGKLHGEWVDVDDLTESEIDEEAKRIIAASPEQDADEYFIADHEGFPGGLLDGPYPAIGDAVTFMDIMGNHDWVDEDVRDVLWAHCDDLDHFESVLENGLFSIYSSEAEWAYEVSGWESADIPEHLQHYFDTEAYVRDAKCSGVSFERLGMDSVLVIEAH